MVVDPLALSPEQLSDLSRVENARRRARRRYETPLLEHVDHRLGHLPRGAQLPAGRGGHAASPRTAASAATRRSSRRTRVSASVALHAARRSALARSRRSAAESASSSTCSWLISNSSARCVAYLTEIGHSSL